MCMYIYLYKKSMHLHSLPPVCWIPYLSQTLSFISNTNVWREAEQVELLSASQGFVASECNVVPRQKNNLLVL